MYIEPLCSAGGGVAVVVVDGIQQNTTVLHRCGRLVLELFFFQLHFTWY